MKTLKLLVCLFCLCSPAFAGDNPNPNVSVLSKKRDIFYFKVRQSFIGARIDVRDNDGHIIATEEVRQKKSIVDFYFEKPGTFTITITKGDKQETFQYNKTTPSPFVEVAPDYHVTIQ
jgi:hypothetical protein